MRACGEAEGRAAGRQELPAVSTVPRAKVETLNRTHGV